MLFNIVMACCVLLAVILAFIVRAYSANKLRMVYAVLFALSVFFAFWLKSGNEQPAVSAFIPLYKVFAISQYGYMAILKDLLMYAVPFVLTGFLAMPAFPKFNALYSFASGMLISLVLNVYSLFIDAMPFITDEYLFAGIGMGCGTGIYCAFTWLIRKKQLLKKASLPEPGKLAMRSGIILVCAVYLFIAFVMIADFGEVYSPLAFSKSETPLPDDITCTADLESDVTSAYVFGPASSDNETRARLVAAALGIQSDVTYDGLRYIADDGDHALTFADNGSWTYEYYGEVDMTAIMSASEASGIALETMGREGMMTTYVDAVTDTVAKADDNDRVIGYDFYFTTAINGCPIVASNTVTVSVRGNGTVTKIRKYDCDLAAEASRKLITPSDAYSKLLSGEGMYTLYTDAESVVFESVQLAYMANSSQGYYIPIWLFTATAYKADGTTVAFDAYVQAMK